MDSSVLQCIQVRVDFFTKYYDVPETVKAHVDAFTRDMYTLGETVENAQEFEAQFAAKGFQERLNGLLMRCAPKPYQMTKEEKTAAKETAKEIFREDRGRIIKEAGMEALDYVSVMAEEEVIARSREKMIEMDIHDDVTRVGNAVDMAVDAGKLFKKLFGKRKG